MALTVTVTPGIVMRSGELIDTAKLNRLGAPTVAITGETEAGDISGIETPTVAHLANAPFFRYKTTEIRGTGQTPIGEPVTLNPIDVRAFGAIGDGLSHPVSEWITDGTYANLAAVQVAFPWVTSASDEIDYAAIQGACDYAWSRLKASSGSTDPSPSAAATVIIPAGTYQINRTVIVPPKCAIRGVGPGNTVIQYDPVADYKWTWVNTGANSALISSGGVYAALYLRARVAVSRTNITDAVSHTADWNEASTGAGTTEWSDGGSVSDLTIGLKANDSCAILATTLKHVDFARLRLRDAAASAGTGKYGIAITAASAAGLATGCGFKALHLETLKVGLLIDQGVSVVVRDSWFTRTAYAVQAPRLSSSIIAANVISNRADGVKGTYAVSFLGAAVTVSGNVIDGFDRAIFVAGGGLAITGNAIVTHANTTAADGYAILVQNAAGYSTETLTYPVATMDQGISVTGNTLSGGTAALPAVASYKPFLFTSSGPALEVNAGANGAAAGAAAAASQYRTLGAATVARILDTPNIIAATLPTGLPDFVGQQWVDTAAGKTYCAVTNPSAVTTGNIVAAVVYWVCGPGTITYNSITYNPGATFTGVAGQTGFTAAGGATVYAPPWRATTLDLVAPTFQVVTLNLVTTASRVLIAAEMAAFLRVDFNDLADNATVTLPAPGDAANVQTTLIITKAARSGYNSNIVLASLTALRLIDNSPLNLPGTGLPDTTANLTNFNAGLKVVMVHVKSDGYYWYLTR